MSGDGAERNRAMVEALFDQVINAHRADLAARYYRPDYVQHNPDVAQGIAGVTQLLAVLFGAFPDLHAHIVLSVAEQDKVMVLVEWNGTQRGAFAGIPPTGRSVEFKTAEIFRVENGLFAEHWDVVDNARMMLTLGMLQAATGA